MPDKKIKHFDDADIKELDDYYDTEIEVNGKEISLDLNFNSSSVDEKMVERVNKFVDRIAEIDTINASRIKEDMTSGDTVTTYLEHHLELLDDEEFKPRVSPAFSKSSPEEQLLSLVHLVRVGLYPENDEHFATFDYSVGDDMTQYLIVLFIKEDGGLFYMTMES